AMARRSLDLSGACLGVGVVRAPCVAEPQRDAELEELRALLRDEPLPALDAPPSALALARPPGAPGGHWRFDDCDPGGAVGASAARLLAPLVDASADLNPAYRSPGVRCSDGVIGRAVALAGGEDVVTV